MTYELIELFFGVLFLTLAVSYAWWSRARVLLFRERLFQIRDELWDRARALGSLDDPAHREMRRILNATIRGADLISAPALVFVARRAGNIEGPTVPTADEPAMQAAIEDARKAMVLAIITYVSLWQASGVLTAVAFLLRELLKKVGARRRSFGAAVSGFVENWLRVSGPERFSHAEELVKEHSRKRLLGV